MEGGVFVVDFVILVVLNVVVNCSILLDSVVGWDINVGRFDIMLFDVSGGFFWNKIII